MSMEIARDQLWKSWLWALLRR